MTICWSAASCCWAEDANRLINEKPEWAAEIYLKAEPSSPSVREIQEILRDGSNIFQVAPQGTMAFAEFIARTGMLHNPPGSWKDVFFPFIHDRDGSLAGSHRGHAAQI